MQNNLEELFMEKSGAKSKKNAIVTAMKDRILIIASIAKAYDYTLIHHDKHFRLVTKHLDISIMDFIDEQ